MGVLVLLWLSGSRLSSLVYTMHLFLWMLAATTLLAGTHPLHCYNPLSAKLGKSTKP